jgi:crotonobetainyl-CoA:carnitine CoA-transferase CaiB-like acyl-CoA transferase
MTTKDIAHLPLAGVRVLELSQIMAGPTCGLMLADLGAEVIKVEKFPEGDDARNYRQTGAAGLPPSFMILNRGKKSIGIDLRSEEGKATLKRLVAEADVVTENFRLGVMEKLGLSYDELRKHNPALIYCSITGYGRQGPLAAKGGFDLILQAFSGILSVTGEAGGPPVKPGVSIADINAGILAAFGILAAYIHRLKTGKGQRVDTSLLQASIQQTYWFASAYFGNGVIGKASGTAHPLIAPYQVFRCADGDIALGGANQSNWVRITEVLGHREWQDDPRFSMPATRLANRSDLEVLINDALGTRTVAEWLATFDAAGVPVGPVQNIAQALEHEQTRAVGMVVDTDAPNGKKTRALGLPVILDGQATPATGVPPRVGENTRAVLLECSFTTAEIDALIEKGAVFQAAEHATLQ